MAAVDAVAALFCLTGNFENFLLNKNSPDRRGADKEAFALQTRLGESSQVNSWFFTEDFCK